MKRNIKLIIVLLLMVMCVPVFALEHKTSELIEVGESATVETDMFTYTEFTYSPEVKGETYGRFTFSNITNKASKKVPISIDLLVFDSNKKNIGFVTYCTEQDYDGDYAQRSLGIGKSTPFYIDVTSKYFAGGAGPMDVAYFAVLDENPYCHVGGYDKYSGLTMEQIAAGFVVTDTEDGEEKISFDVGALSELLSAGLIVIVITVLVCIGIFVFIGTILNALNKRMFATTTPLAYLPIANGYVAVKLAFGQKAALIFVIAYFITSAMMVVNILGFLFYIVSFINSVAFIIDIIKLITKKYDLCYMEPFTTQNVAVGGTFSLKHGTVPVDEEKEGKFISPKDDTEEEIIIDEPETVDLSFQSNNDSFIETDSGGDSFSFDAEDFSASRKEESLLDDDIPAPPKEPVENKENNQEGESDLMNLFK